MANALVDLTTLANVKGWLGISSETDDDALLARLITSYSQWLQNQMARQLVAAVITETIDGGDARIRTRPTVSPWLAGAMSGGGVGVGQQGWALGLREFPVSAIGSMVIDGAAVPQGTNPNQPSQTDGWLLVDKNRIEFLGTTYAFTRGVQNIVVVYAAGYGPAGVQAAFTASITGTVLTVTAIAAGVLAAGLTLADVTGALAANTFITAQLTGATGGIGTYQLSGAAQTVGSESMTVSTPPLPGDIEQCVIDLVAWRFRQKDRVGQKSSSMGGDNVTFMSDADAPTADAVIGFYGRINI